MTIFMKHVESEAVDHSFVMVKQKVFRQRIFVPDDILYLVGENLVPADVQWIKGDKICRLIRLHCDRRTVATKIS